MTLTFEIKTRPEVPLEVEGVIPASVRELTVDQILKLPIFHGNNVVEIGDFFELSGDPSDELLRWEGDLSPVHWIGAKMSSGTIHIEGDCGRHLGSEMSGGEIHVTGNASDWVGGEMHGGLIHVRGRAGHLVGAAYRGSAKGMTNGTILIGGDVGNEVGHTMRRGLIVVGGKAGDLVGFNMLAGSVIVHGEAGIRHGAGMRRGTIAFVGDNPPPMLSSFRYACRMQPEFFRLIGRMLTEQQFEPGADGLDGDFDLYHGDFIEGGRGEILVKSP